MAVIIHAFRASLEREKRSQVAKRRIAGHSCEGCERSFSQFHRGCVESLRKSSRYGNISPGRDVHVISYKAIREFKAARPDAGPALDNWYRVSSVGKWASFAEVKQVFGSADWVKPYVVFNVAGNKYRLIAEINFRSQTLFIRHILTHQEYAEGKWKKP